MKIIPNPSSTIEDVHPGSVQGRNQAAPGGERASSGRHAPQSLEGFSGSVIRVGVARVPSRRLNHAGK